MGRWYVWTHCLTVKNHDVYFIICVFCHSVILNSISSSLSAEPVVRGEMTHLPEGSVFIYCQVGERA